MAGVSYSSSLKWEGDRIGRRVATAGARGINQALEFLRARSVPLAPLDQGPLRESASIVPAVGSGNGNVTEGMLVFDTPYAVVQHERMDYQHDQGQAKYLSEPAAEYDGVMKGMIAKAIRIEMSA